MISNRAKKVTIPTCALLVIALTSLSPSPAQTAPATDSAAPAIEFDVVSIKLNKSGDAKMEHSFPANGDTMTFTNMPLFIIIMYLYNADRPGKLTGFPGWARAERYDITAKVTGASVAPFLSLDPARRKVMLQKVLADRFKLQIHSEKMVSPVYELVAAKNGPRMRPAQDSDIPANGRTTLYNGFGQLTGQAATMEDLAYSLSDTPGMDRQVVDKTGLPGRYSFTLRSP